MERQVDGQRNVPSAEGHERAGEFGELFRYTAAGFAGGLLLAGALDNLGFSRSGLGQWAVRTLLGEGESVFEGLYALRRRLAGRGGSMAVAGFYVPYFYALGDQMGASILRHPVILASLLVVLVVPAALAVARMLGFSPTTQLLTAAETIAANLCWLPPLVGGLSERRAAERRRASG